MKTLDEVIWAVEHCDSAIDDCAHCPYCKEDCENLRPLRADALHYLKEFQGLSKMWNDKLVDYHKSELGKTWQAYRKERE